MERRLRTVPELWSGFGANVSQPSAFWYTYTAELGAPFVPHVTNNFKRVRTYVDLSSQTSRTAIHTWALQLKAAKPDIYIVFGATRGGLSSTNQDAYTAAVIAEAQWAHENNMDEFQISNETENNKHSSLTDAQVRAYIRSLATQVKQVFTRPISYAVAQGREDGWIAEGKGDLNRIAFNIYGHNGTFSSFVNIARKVHDAFGDDCYVSEWNLHPSWLESRADGLAPGDMEFERAYANEVVRRQKVLQYVGFTEAYFFALWSFAEGFGIDYFSLWKKEEGFRPAFYAVGFARRQMTRRPITGRVKDVV